MFYNMCFFYKKGMELKMFTNKKIFVLGFARSGYDAAKLLIKRGNYVLINDGKEEAFHDETKINELKEMGCHFLFGSHPEDLLDESFDYVIKNPGIKIDHPYVLKAHNLNIPVINEVELAYKLLPKDVTLIGITGTNGKTTTTTLTYEIMHKAFKERVHLAGNIGYPLCSILDKLKKDDIIVIEVSCQQSENIIDFHPDVALITNFSPAHIDFFGSYENYKRVKAKMFYNQKEDNIAILNYKNTDVLKELSGIKSKVRYFNGNSDCYLKDNAIYYLDEKVIDTKIVKIPGHHNLENCMASISIAKQFGVTNEVIGAVISNFIGVRHRLEFIREVKGVRYYNDTEATNIKCTQIALSSFTNPTIIILGGLERGQNFDDLKPFIKNVKVIIGIGECRNRVLEFGKKNNIETYIYEYLRDGFNKIEEIKKENDVVLLSPASASWDQYKECEVRGDEFRDLVNKL